MSLHSEEEHRARSCKQKHQSDKILWMYAWMVCVQAFAQQVEGWLWPCFEWCVFLKLGPIVQYLSKILILSFTFQFCLIFRLMSDCFESVGCTWRQPDVIHKFRCNVSLKRGKKGKKPAKNILMKLNFSSENWRCTLLYETTAKVEESRGGLIS